MNNIYQKYKITHMNMKMDAQYMGTHFGQTELFLYKTKELTFIAPTTNEDYAFGLNAVQALDNYSDRQRYKKFEIEKSR